MTRNPIIRIHLDDDEMVVDNFAGGGGASSGIEWAINRSPDIAINHDAEAIDLHRANHPSTKHYVEDIWDVDPKEACGGRRVGLVWCSPDCKHFSKAKGAVPLNQKIRGLAWAAVRWATDVRPRIICLENVIEFQTWGPLGHDGMPIKARAGETFREFIGQLEALGYVVEWREMRACDYGAPTNRRRLFLVARCDGHPIAWPEPTHGPGRALPYRTAAECIDWSVEAPSIFGRKKTHAEKTLARIARGIRRYVVQAEQPFLAPVRAGKAVVAPYLVHRSNGERPVKVDADGTVHAAQAPRVYPIDAPLGTIMAQGQKQALVNAFLLKHNGGANDKCGASGQELTRPIDSITSRDSKSLATVSLALASDPEAQRRARAVYAFLVRYNGKGEPEELTKPLGTLTTHDRYGLVTVTVGGEQYVIVDIGMRMLTPRELFSAQGFPEWTTILRGEAWRDQTTHKAGDRHSSAGLDSAPHAESSSSRASLVSASSKRAAVHVRIDLGRSALELRSRAGSNQPASSAEPFASFPLPTDIAASARRLAPGGSCEDRRQPDGRAETCPSNSRSTSRSSGMSPASSSGSATGVRASGAAVGFAVSLDRRATQFTISPDGRNTLLSDSIVTTLCSYAARVIGSSTLARTLDASSFDLEIEITHRYNITAEEVRGEPLTKTAQVRCVGNSVAPPIAAAIVRAQFASSRAGLPAPSITPVTQLRLPIAAPEPEALRVGDRVSFLDDAGKRRVGEVLRVGKRTVTIDAAGWEWGIAPRFVDKFVARRQQRGADRRAA